MAQTRGTYAALYDNVDKVVYAGLNQYLKELPATWRKIYSVEDAGNFTKFMRVQQTVGMGDVPEKPEGQAYATDLIRQGAAKDYTYVEFGLGFEVTETALEDDQHDQLDKNTMWLAFSARYVEGKRAANVFNNGFTTETTPDGSALFTTTHALGGGGTASNQHSGNADLSANSLEQAVIDLSTNTKLESGQVAQAPDSLVLYVPPALEFIADRIINSTQRPGSADNDKNALDRRRWSIVVDPLLTDTDAWFVLAGNKKMHGIFSVTRVPITMVPPMTDTRTGNRIYKVRFRRVWGAKWWQHAYGSSGA